jgi:hypothetical protein
MTKRMILVTVLVLSSVPLGGVLIPTTSYAGDWSINVWGGSPYYYNSAPRYRYGYNQGYYPYYRPYNPVVRRDYYSGGGYAPDGTYHGEDVVEDRRASYYSPGRNQAITPPRTSVQSWNYGPGQQTTRERTSWIGADGRPHSTTIDRNTRVDPWGNTHTDTHVTLKKKPAGGSSTTPKSVAPSAPSSPPAPISSPPSAPSAPSAAPSASN